MKFIYFQDAHIKGKNSQNRLGNYFEDCLTKFDELINLARCKDCDYIIDGGDLFESYAPSYSVLDAIANKLELAKIQVYSLFGNHCMNAGHIENNINTGLAHLQQRSDFFNYLNRKKYLGNQMQKYDIKVIDYKYNIEEELKTQKIFFEDKEAFNILIAHALITPNKFFEGTSYVQCKDIKTNADLVLCAHYHHPFKKEINGTTFLNIGCFGRNNINESDIEPSVLLIDTEKRSYDIIKLKSAKKGNKIFDLTKYEELKANKKDIKAFLNSLRDVHFQSMNLGQQITKIGKEQEIDKSIVDYLLTKMEQVK